MILISKQIQVELQGSFGTDRDVASAAWTSSLSLQAKDKRSDVDVERVVNMLADQKHSTPFESIILRFWIKMPISCDRQFMTHRLQSSNGMSGRYRSMPNEFLEMSEDVKNIINKLPFDASDFISDYNEISRSANNTYQCLITDLKKAEKDGLISNQELKRAREFYRGVLPQHNMTERVSIMNLRSFCNFIKLRDSEHAQPEIRQVAQLMLKAVEDAEIAPIALQALKRNNWTI